MGQIDLSVIQNNISGMGRERAYFNDEGASVYRELGKFTDKLTSTAMDLYAKQQDINTDREALKALNDYQQKIALESDRALKNIDPETGYVIDDFNNLTDKTYASYMQKFMDDLSNGTNESLKDVMSQNKFKPVVDKWITEQNVSNIFQTTDILKKLSTETYNKKVSSTSDGIRKSDSLNVIENLNKGLSELHTKETPSFVKINGVAPAHEITQKANKALLESSWEVVLREGEVSPEAGIPASQLLGINTMFKTGKEYSAFVLTRISDMSDSFLSKTDMEKLDTYLQNEYVSYMDQKPHELSNLWTPEEKDKHLKEFLSLRIKGFKADQSSINNKLENWIAHFKLHNFNTKDIGSSLKEGALLLQLSSKDPSEKLEVISRSVQSMRDGILLRNRMSGDKYALVSANKEIQKLEKQFKDTLISASGLNAKDVAEAEKMYPSTVGAAKNRVAAEKDWRKREEKLNKELATPNGVASHLSKFVWINDNFNKAVKLGNGYIEINSGAFKQAADIYMASARSLGTFSSQLASTEIMQMPIFSKMMTHLETVPPEQKRQAIEQINKSSPQIASAFIQQAVKNKVIDLEEADLYRSLKVSNPNASKQVSDKLLFIDNKFGKKDIKEWLTENLKVGGFWGVGEETADTISESIDSSIKKSQFVKDMVEVGEATGFATEEIKGMYNNKRIKKGVLLNMKENPDNSMFTKLSTKVGTALDNVLKDTYGDNVPVNHPNLKIVAPVKNRTEMDIIANTSSRLAKRISNAISRGELKYDTQSLTPYNLKDMPENQRQWFERDTKNGAVFNENNIALVGKTIDGTIGEMTLMYKDRKSGKFMQMKLLDKNGKTYTPTINSVEDLKSDNVDNIYNKFIQR